MSRDSWIPTRTSCSAAIDGRSFGAAWPAKRYAQIAAAGGGIVSTVAATRTASETELAEAARIRLSEMRAAGTTTCEIKSGYGLTTAAEIKLLRVIDVLKRTEPMTIVPTFMGAHEVPTEYRGARDRYVDLVVKEMIPAAAAAGLAEWCDVFCERGCSRRPRQPGFSKRGPLRD